MNSYKYIQKGHKEAQQEAQQEARQYVGSVVNYDEQAHINKRREEKSKTEQAEKRTKTKETSERNTAHKNERTPDNRAKAKKQRAGPSPDKNTDTLPKVPPFPTGEKASGSQGKPKNNNPTIVLNRNTSLKENQVGHEIIKDQNQILKDHLLLDKMGKHQTQNMTLT